MIFSNRRPKPFLASLIVFLSSILFSHSSFAMKANDLTLRQIEGGEIIGFSFDDQGGERIFGWRGIPYAKAPIGELRWKAPRSVEKWQGLKETVNKGSLCPQLAGPLTSLNVFKWNKVIGNEDCLFINVTAPANIQNTDKKLPVMFWIHGGGNSIGQGGNPLYTGEHLASKGDVVVVTINYRLGPLGWFYHPALNQADASPEDNSGNYGTLDIIHALKWVKNNITAFGGDPNNITVFGESAGGANTYSMLLSPLASGLFHKAIVQSGGIGPVSLGHASNARGDGGHDFSSHEIVNLLMLENKLAATRDGASILQKNTSAKKLANVLRTASAESIVAFYPTRAAGMLSMPGMVRDGYVLPIENPVKVFSQAENYNAVPVMLGTNRDENKLFMALDPRWAKWGRIIDINKYNRASNYMAQGWKLKGVDEIATAMRQAQGPSVFAYRFDWDNLPSVFGTNFSELIGSGHGLEIPFVFGVFRPDFPAFKDPSRIALSDTLISYWSQFAYHGDPGKGRQNKQVEWTPWNNDNPDTNKFIILDARDDSGTDSNTNSSNTNDTIRMSNEAVTTESLKNRLATDTSFVDNRERCELYYLVFVNRSREHFNQEEYDNFGPKGCKAFSIESFSP